MDERARPDTGGLPPRYPPRHAGAAALVQHWRDVVFVHWAVEPDAVAGLLPPGTRPDVWEGRTYVGLVAFRVAAPRLAGAVPTGAFDEANVRLYSVDDRGNRGVVFLSMDADALPSVVAARALAGVPYIWSDVSLRTGPAGAAGAVHRRFPGPRADGSWHVAVGRAITETGGLERFLTARWGLHATHLGATLWLPVSHPPWRLFRAELRSYAGDLLTAAGVDAGRAPPISALWSPGTDAAFHLPQRVRRHRRPRP